MELTVTDQLALAKLLGVQQAALTKTEKEFATWSGENPAILS